MKIIFNIVIFGEKFMNMILKLFNILKIIIIIHIFNVILIVNIILLDVEKNIGIRFIQLI